MSLRGNLLIIKLRVFVSLVIEQEKTGDAAENYGIRPLPNLETRFVAADALLGLGGGGAQGVLGDGAVTGLRERLRRVREGYFNARTREAKRARRAEDERLRADLAAALAALGFGHGDAEAVAGWDPYDQNAGSGWFDPAWMFGAPAGFDVVIGNPPYIRGEKVRGKAALRAAFGDFYKAAADLYTYFFRRGVDFLAEGGALCFIASNKFMRTEYGGPLRAFLARRAPPVSILDFGRTGTFDATVRPLVLLARKGGGHDSVRAATVRGGGGGASDPGAFLARHGFALPLARLSAGGWALARPELLRLRDKIERAGTPLGEYAKGGIRYGLKTGFNKAFVIDAETRHRLIDEDPKSAELIKPWLRGRDVRRYRMEWKELYVIFTQGIDITRYPAIERHLAHFRADLQPKTARGGGPGRAPGNYKWFEFQATIAYREVFYSPKIVYPDIGTEMRAVLDREDHLVGNTCFIIPGDDPYLLAILNSKVLDVWFRLSLPCLDDPFDGGHMRFLTKDMEGVPIPSAPPAVKKRLVTLANCVQSARQVDPAADAASLGAEIDEAVRALYGLDERDIALIEKLPRP